MYLHSKIPFRPEFCKVINSKHGCSCVTAALQTRLSYNLPIQVWLSFKSVIIHEQYKAEATGSCALLQVKWHKRINKCMTFTEKRLKCEASRGWPWETWCQDRSTIYCDSNFIQSFSFFYLNAFTKQWLEVKFVTCASCPATESSHLGYIVMKYECQTGVSLSTDAAITKEELKTLN